MDYRTAQLSRIGFLDVNDLYHEEDYKIDDKYKAVKVNDKIYYVDYQYIASLSEFWKLFFFGSDVFPPQDKYDIPIDNEVFYTTMKVLHGHYPLDNSMGYDYIKLSKVLKTLDMWLIDHKHIFKMYNSFILNEEKLNRIIFEDDEKSSAIEYAFILSSHMYGDYRESIFPEEKYPFLYNEKLSCYPYNMKEVIRTFKELKDVRYHKFCFPHVYNERSDTANFINTLMCEDEFINDPIYKPLYDEIYKLI